MIHELGNQFLRSLYGVEGLILGPTSALAKAVSQAQFVTQFSFLMSHLSGAVTPASPWATSAAAELPGAMSSLRLAPRDQGGAEPAPVPVPGVGIARGHSPSPSTPACLAWRAVGQV